MKYSKQTVIEALKHSIEHANERIEKLSEPTVKSSVHNRSAECDFWKKKLKGYQKELKELEDE